MSGKTSNGVFSVKSPLNPMIETMVTTRINNDSFTSSSANTSSCLELEANSSCEIIYNKENIGLTKSLNKGLKYSKGQFIVRQDADDYSSIDRLKRAYDLIKLKRFKIQSINALPNLNAIGKQMITIITFAQVGSFFIIY